MRIKTKVTCRRLFTISGKIAIFLFFIIVCILLSFFLIAYCVIYLEEGYWIGTTEMLSWYKMQGHDTNGYIPTIVVATISLLLTLTTILQAHYNRLQDRVMNFPKNYISLVSMNFDLNKNIMIGIKYFNQISAKTLIEFSFKEGFTTYYKACPYRLFICLQKINDNKKAEWEELIIYNFHFSNLLDKNPSNYEVLVETSESGLLKRYCENMRNKQNYSLKLILDIRWSNYLLPFLQRIFSDVYIRKEIELNRVKEGNAKEFSHSYKVLFTEHKIAPLKSWLLEKKCRTTASNLKKHNI